MEESYVLPIHFDNFQGKHEINSDSLIIFVEAYKEIAEFFGLNIEIQIGVPEEGGWIAKLAFIISFVGGISPFLSLLTGETADDWGKKGHVYLVEKINEFITQEANNIPDKFPKECIKQKNKMYQQFQKDNCIDTFHLADYPPIPRGNFHLYIKDVPIYLGETNITVHSPDWTRKRSWTGKIEIIREEKSAFAFDKDLTGKFWEMVRLNALPLYTTDVMRVQLIKRPTNTVKYLVIRVLSYNNEEIDSLIDEKHLHKIAIFDAKTDLVKRPPQSEFLF